MNPRDDTLIACSNAILVDDPTELGEQLAGGGNS